MPPESRIAVCQKILHIWKALDDFYRQHNPGYAGCCVKVGTAWGEIGWLWSTIGGNLQPETTPRLLDQLSHLFFRKRPGPHGILKKDLASSCQSTGRQRVIRADGLGPRSWAKLSRVGTRGENQMQVVRHVFDDVSTASCTAWFSHLMVSSRIDDELFLRSSPGR